ncbi:MAG: lipoate--protein ligase family protein [Atribacterota bacterium]|jgi:lipoate-protein ligase A|nr:lipoate--protein ligase family protein [Atribacterota bacterium]MDD4895183.1 lipoate--protein ligase family protein [Atribacterota bacterium]MDD5636934.1 lipoate--protein ligase family protein [Atribacterota bacterium]
MRLILIDIPNFEPEINFQIEKKILNIYLTDALILRFWQNNPCAVIGKFQKEEYELNLDYVTKNKISLFRRFTGGGTVYHDRGNLNITLCKSKDKILFSKYFLEETGGITNVILEGLLFFHKSMEIKERNSIFLDGKKVLGSAVAIKNNNFFYHASLLVNADLGQLRKVIKWEENYPENIRIPIKSKRSEVTNLSCGLPLSIDEVKEKILINFQHLLKIEDKDVKRFNNVDLLIEIK